MNPKLPYQDFTIKAKVVRADKIEETLLEINGTFIGVDHQKDIYFKVAKGKLKWRQGTIENLITHYERIEAQGLEKTIVYRYDLNPTLEEISKLYKDFTEIGSIEKERKIFYLGNIKIHLDKMNDNQTFIEIEVIDKEGTQSVDELRLQCLEMKEKLGIKDEMPIRTGYF